MSHPTSEAFITLSFGNRCVLTRRPGTFSQLVLFTFHEFNICPRHAILIKMDCPFDGDKEVELLASAYPMVRNGDELRITEILGVRHRLCTDCVPQQ
jgi:hypothetical protein